MSTRTTQLRDRVIERAVRGPGMSGIAARRAAFENSRPNPRARDLMAKVVRQAWTITDEDVAAARAAGLSDDEIFELTICAALGQATRQLNAALAALDAATGRER
jgi:alkylhydroperoxidase family enzyme